MKTKKLSIILVTMVITFIGSLGAMAEELTNTAKYTLISYTPELKAAAEAGDAEAQYVLGRSYLNGIGVEKNEAEGVKWYQKAVAQNNPMAMRCLGRSYENGTGGLEKSMTKANEYYTQALSGLKALVANNNGLAANILGMMYYLGESTPKDLNKAFTYYKKAAELGDAEGARRLGYAYNFGEGTTKNLEKAVEWYKKGAEAGDATAMFNLALMYKNGQGTPQNYQKAIEWYTKAANAGNASAMFSLGNMYNNGQGIPQNSQKAIEWYTKAANAGYAAAMFNLGNMYNNGQGIPQNYQKAIEWYTKAANAGYADAMNNLGVYYSNVAKDYKKAQYWYKKGLDANPDDYLLKSNLSLVEKKISTEQTTKRLYAKYGKEVVDAYYDGRIIVGMPLELVNYMTAVLLLNGRRVSGNANSFVMKYTPCFYTPGELSEVYYVTFNARTNKVTSYKISKEYLH